MANVFAVFDTYQPNLSIPAGSVLSNYSINENLQLMKNAQLRAPSVMMAVSDSHIKNPAIFEKNLSNPNQCVNLCRQIYKEVSYLGYGGVYMDLQSTQTDTLYSSLSSMRAKNIPLYLNAGRGQKIPNNATLVIRLDPASYFVREINHFTSQYPNRELYLKSTPRCLLYDLPDLKSSPSPLSFAQAKTLQETHNANTFFDTLRECDYFTLINGAKGQICLQDSKESYQNLVKTAILLGIKGFFMDYGRLSQLYGEDTNRFLQNLQKE